MEYDLVGPFLLWTLHYLRTDILGNQSFSTVRALSFSFLSSCPAALASPPIVNSGYACNDFSPHILSILKLLTDIVFKLLNVNNILD